MRGVLLGLNVALFREPAALHSTVHRRRRSLRGSGRAALDDGAVPIMPGLFGGRDHAMYAHGMSRSQLIPAPEFAPPSIAHLSPADRILLWARMVDEGDRFIYDGFRRRYATEAEVQQAVAEWLERRSAESTPAKIRMLKGRRPQVHDGE